MSNDPFLLSYSKYPLARILTVYQLVSADYVTGTMFGRAHSHRDAVELVCCLTGTISVSRGSASVALSSDEILIINSGIRHEIISESTDAVFFIAAFTCRCDYLDTLTASPMKVSDDQKLFIFRIIQELKNAFRLNGGELRLFSFKPNRKSPIGAEQLICCYLEALMIGLLREITRENGQVVESRAFDKMLWQHTIGQVQDYVRSHIQERITVSDIAAEFHYSRSRLSTHYKEVTGLGLSEFITRERIRQAKEMLEAGDRTVTEISELLGFSSPEYFCRRFTQCAGVSPSRYVEIVRETSHSSQS